MNQQEKNQRIARLIVLLNKLETELTNIQTTLYKMGADKPELQPVITEKLTKLQPLLEKVRKARLNLNFSFL